MVRKEIECACVENFVKKKTGGGVNTGDISSTFRAGNSIPFSLSLRNVVWKPGIDDSSGAKASAHV